MPAANIALTANSASEIPGLIEAENYDLGGQNTAYYDTTAGNAGGQYRTDDVDVEACSEGGYSIGYIAAGEWAAYSIYVPQTTAYQISVRLACSGAGGKFRIEVDGQNMTGSMTVPDTGGWQNWSTLSKGGIQLSTGFHVLKLVMESATSGRVGNFNWLRLVSEQDIPYALTVNGGSGGGSYTNGSLVAVTASNVAGKVFDRWAGATQHLSSVIASPATVTMPGSNITVTATYRDIQYTLTVSGGTGSSTTYTNQQRVTITANVPAAGKVFDRWTGDTQHVVGVTSATTVVTMPAANISVAATYKDVPYTLTVNNGAGSGAYTNQQQVTIVASNVTGKVFDRWTGATQHIANVTSATATVTMPASNITVTAVFVLPIPGKIEMEDYDLGGPGVAYYDSTTGNAGGQCRSDDVDIAACSEGGYLLGWAIAGEWLTYSINVQAAGSYQIETRVACSGTGGKFHIEVDGQNVTGSISMPNTGGWQTWVTVSTGGIPLTAGSHKLKLVMDVTSSGGGVGNFNYLNLTGEAANGVPQWWLDQYGITNVNDTARDADLDGLLTWQEYIAGCNPTNKASCFRVTQESRNVIQWNAVSGRVYSVHWTTNLLSGFQCLRSNIPYTQSSFTNPTTVPCSYYKIDVRLAE
jgi:predicted Rdx family selenoprotein